mmetsp:Transcript_11219/g.28422  ORF Transcript_11219/g.28422 Transcript_11219/m.28422 type:complete len:226 (-) Transcript_11219:334-1011(-)
MHLVFKVCRRFAKAALTLTKTSQHGATRLNRVVDVCTRAAINRHVYVSSAAVAIVAAIRVVAILRRLLSQALAPQTIQLRDSAIVGSLHRGSALIKLIRLFAFRLEQRVVLHVIVNCTFRVVGSRNFVAQFLNFFLHLVEASLLRRLLTLHVLQLLLNLLHAPTFRDARFGTLHRRKPLANAVQLSARFAESFLPLRARSPVLGSQRVSARHQSRFTACKWGKPR